MVDGVKCWNTTWIPRDIWCAWILKTAVKISRRSKKTIFESSYRRLTTILTSVEFARRTIQKKLLSHRVLAVGAQDGIDLWFITPN